MSYHCLIYLFHHLLELIDFLGNMLDRHHSLNELSENGEVLVRVFMIVFRVKNSLDQVVEDEEVRDADFIAAKELLIAEFFLCFELYRLHELPIFIGNLFASKKGALQMRDHDFFS